MDPKRKRLETGPTCRSTQRGEKISVRPLGLHTAVFYACRAKWTTFFDPTAADGLLFLALGPHSLIFFYTMDPKRKRSEPGPHSGPHSGEKIRRAAVSAVCGPEWTIMGRTPMEPEKINTKRYSVTKISVSLAAWRLTGGFGGFGGLAAWRLNGGLAAYWRLWRVWRLWRLTGGFITTRGYRDNVNKELFIYSSDRLSFYIFTNAWRDVIDCPVQDSVVSSLARDDRVLHEVAKRTLLCADHYSCCTSNNTASPGGSTGVVLRLPPPCNA